jgi:hypothetical protein
MIGRLHPLGTRASRLKPMDRVETTFDRQGRAFYVTAPCCPPLGALRGCRFRFTGEEVSRPAATRLRICSICRARWELASIDVPGARIAGHHVRPGRVACRRAERPGVLPVRHWVRLPGVRGSRPAGTGWAPRPGHPRVGVGRPVRRDVRRPDPARTADTRRVGRPRRGGHRDVQPTQGEGRAADHRMGARSRRSRVRPRSASRRGVAAGVLRVADDAPPCRLGMPTDGGVLPVRPDRREGRASMRPGVARLTSQRQAL